MYDFCCHAITRKGTIMEKVIIESFTLDHTKVIAPYVRLIGEEQGEHVDIVSNFDVRLAQPNK